MSDDLTVHPLHDGSGKLMALHEEIELRQSSLERSLSASLVPAAPGFFGIRFIGESYYDQVPIIAWRIYNDGVVQPVTIDGANYEVIRDPNEDLRNPSKATIVSDEYLGGRTCYQNWRSKA